MLSPFCEECGTNFERETAKFCRQCRTPRGTCPDGGQTTRQLEEPGLEARPTFMETCAKTEEVPTEEQQTEDFRGPPAREAVQRHPQQRPPTYNMIFDPPAVPNRVRNKLYGRRCLKCEYPIQHKCYVSNYKRTHEWVNEGQSLGHLPGGEFTLEDPSVRDALKKIITDKKDELMDIRFNKEKNYAWREADIYKKMRKNLKYRRWKQRKAEKSRNGNDSSGTSEGQSSPTPSQLGEPQPTQSAEYREPSCHTVDVGEEEDEDDESFVMRQLNVENVNDMYVELLNFISGESDLARRGRRRVPFPPNSRTFPEREKLLLVATFLRSRLQWSSG